MSKQMQDDLKLLTDAAVAALGDVAESGSYNHVFSFWETPAFSDYTRTSLYVPQGYMSGKRAFASTLRWRREVDLLKIGNPIERLKYPNILEPTIEESIVELTEADVQEVVADLERISIDSLRPRERVVGLDGVAYRFKFDQGYYGCDLKWWCESPVQWSEATRAILKVVSKLV